MYKPKQIYRVSSSHSKPFASDFQKAEKLGDKILKAFKYGADFGAQSSVTYDADADPDSADFRHEVDVLCDPNQDFTDIAEHFGKIVEQSAPPQETNE